MDLSIKYNITNISFNARLSEVEKIKMDAVLSRLLKNDKIDFSGMVNESGYAKNFVYGWFNDKFGLSPQKYFEQRQKQLIDNEFIKLHNQGFTVKQLSEHFSESIMWVKSMHDKHGLIPKGLPLEEPSDKIVLQLLNKGYTLSTIKKISKSSLNEIKNIIKENSNGNIQQYRRNNGIKLNHETKLTRQKQAIQKHFEEGKGIKETAKLTGLSKTALFRSKEEFNIQTTLDRGHELMEIFLPDMVQAHDSLKTMSRFFGLSKSTVSRRIKDLYGNSYSRLIKGQ